MIIKCPYCNKKFKIKPFKGAFTGFAGGTGAGALYGGKAGLAIFGGAIGIPLIVIGAGVGTLLGLGYDYLAKHKKCPHCNKKLK